MWAKILAGALAAVAVGGTGVYFAMTTGTSGGCGGCHGGEVQSISSCCLDAHSCCSGEATAHTDALAACAGPAAFVSADAPACEKGICPKACVSE